MSTDIHIGRQSVTPLSKSSEDLAICGTHLYARDEDDLILVNEYARHPKLTARGQLEGDRLYWESFSDIRVGWRSWRDYPPSCAACILLLHAEEAEEGGLHA